MNWLDWVLIFIIALSVWQGFRSGLIMTAARIMGILLGLAMAMSFYRPLAGYVEQHWQWTTKMSGVLHGMLPLPVSTPANGQITPDIIWELSQQLPLPEAWYRLLVQMPPEVLQENSFTEAVSYLVAQFLVEAVLFLLLFLIGRGLIVILGSVLSRTFSLGPLNILGRIGGAGLGLVRGGLIIMLMVALLIPLQFPVAFFGTQGEPGFIASAAQNSAIVNACWQLLEVLNISLPGLLPAQADIFPDII